MRYLEFLALLLFFTACKPASEKAYEHSFALRAARNIDSTGNTAMASYYLQRAVSEPAARLEAENFRRRIGERRLRTDDCLEAKKTDLAINQYPRIRHKHLFQLGVCFEEAGDTQRALKLYEMSEKANSAQPQLYMRRALLHFKNGDRVRASVDLERAVALNENYPPALLNLALFRVVAGDKTEAESLLAKLKPVRPPYAEIITDALQHQAEIADFFRGNHAR